MLALATTLYKSVTVSGCDGLGMPQALAEGIRAAHPAAARPYGEAEDPAEPIAAAAEARGIAITALTASERPALRRRGAAAPLALVHLADPDAPVTILAIAPELIDRTGRAFAAARLLAAAVEARGARLRIAASQHMASATAPANDEDGDEDDTAEALTIDPVLSRDSRTLGTAARRDPDALPTLMRRALREITHAVEIAAAEAPGPLLLYMAEGSLEHLALLQRIALDRPTVRVCVHLATLRTGDVWASDFTTRHAEALEALASDPAIHATVPTLHQHEALKARTGLALPVAPRPSPFFSDAEAAAAADSPARPPRPHSGPEAATRILLPATRSEDGADDGTALSAEIGAALRVLFMGEALTLVFGADPLAGRGSEAAAALREALGAYEVRQGGLADAALREELAAADAVVLPLLPPDFTDRPSDLAAACLYAKAPVVACAGTWLGAFVDAHRSGLVVDAPAPRALAEAAAQLARASRQGLMDVRFGAQTALAAGSWAGLAEQLLAMAPLPQGTTWRRGESVHLEALRPAALPLLTGPAPASGTPAEIDYGRLLTALELAPDGSRTLWSGLRRTFAQPGQTDPGRGLPGGPLIVADPYVFAAVREAPGWSVVDARRTDPEARTSPLTAATVAALDAAGPETAVILLEGFEEGQAPALWRALARAPRAGVVIDLARPAFTWPGRAAAHIAEELERLGFVTVLVERWPGRTSASEHTASGPATSGPGAMGPPTMGPGAHALRRVTFGPVWPSVPGVPCDVVAVRDRDAATLKAAFADAVAPPDLALPRICAGAPEVPSPAAPAGAPTDDEPLAMSPAATLKAVRDPATEGWALVSLTRAGSAEDGFVPYAETEAADKRVHSAGVRIEAQAPLTVSVEVQPLTTRYLTLAVAGPKNRALAAAVFDLVEDEVLSVTRDSRVVASAPRAGLAPSGADGAGRTVRRLFLSLEDLAAVGPVQAQVVLRQDASGSVHYVGTPQRRIGLRHLVVERRAEPSRLPTEGIAAPPAPEYGALPGPAAPDLAEGRPSVPGAPAEPAPEPEPPAPFTADLLARALGADPGTNWVAAAQATAEHGDEGLAFQRNGCPYPDQLMTRVDVREAGPYLVTFDFAAVAPEVHIVVNDKVVARTNEAGEVAVEVGVTGPAIAIELRAANSHMGRFVLRGLTVTAAA